MENKNDGAKMFSLFVIIFFLAAPFLHSCGGGGGGRINTNS